MNIQWLTFLTAALATVPYLVTQAQTLSVSGNSASVVSARLTASVNMPPTAANLSVAPFSTQGVTLIPYGSPAFARLLKASLPSMLPAPVLASLPYSVFIENGGSKSVIAYTLSWSSLDNAGHPSADYHTVWDILSLTGLILPRAASLATIIGSLTATVLGSDPLLLDLAEQYRALQDKSSVTITLEAVVFSDGTSLGRDNSGSVPQMRARLQSEHDLYKAVLARAASDSDAALSSWLQNICDEVKPGAVLKLGGGTDPGWYRYYRARISAYLLNFARARGVLEMIAYVRSTLETKPYPAIL